MHLEQRNAGDVVIVTVNGDINMSTGGDVVLKDKIGSLLQQGHKKLLVDLGGVAMMDSTGLGSLVQCYATASNRGAVLKLARVTKRINDLLVVTKLVTVFETFETEAAALASFVKA